MKPTGIVRAGSDMTTGWNDDEQRSSGAPIARRARQVPGVSQVAVLSGAVRTICIGGQDAIRADGEIVGKGNVGAQTRKS